MRFGLAVIVFLTSGWLSSISYGQETVTDCEQVLTNALDEFNAGRFYGVPAMLKNCLERGFTREQRQRAHLLLTQIYLLQDDPLGAENSYLELLRANPEFQPDQSRDPIEVVYLSKRFTADPVISLYGKGGGNLAPVRVIHEIKPSGEAGTSTNYKLKVGFQAGVGAEWHFMQDVSLVLGADLLHTSYVKEHINFNNDNSEFVDNQNWLSIPLALKYTHGRKDIRPFGYVGVSANLLISDNGKINQLKIDTTGGQTIAIPAESPVINFKAYRNSVNRTFFFGGGIMYKTGLDFLTAELRYSFGLNNIVRSTSTYDNTGPAPEYGHTDDYFRLDNLAISIGYIKPLYKPRKLKRARTRAVLRGLNKGS